MFGLFNRKSGFKAALQAYNALTMCVAAYGLMTNPQAKFSEVGADVLIHAISLYSLRENAGALLQIFSSGANMFRMGSIYAALTLEGSSVPTSLNATDMVNHLLNTVAGLIPNEEEKQELCAKCDYSLV